MWVYGVVVVFICMWMIKEQDLILYLWEMYPMDLLFADRLSQLLHQVLYAPLVELLVHGAQAIALL